MKFDILLTDLKNKIYKPIYLLHGEEEYFINIISDYIEDHILDEAEREFNQTVMYGKDVDAGTIIDTARRYPMMSNYQVVIVKEAQALADIEELKSYAEKPFDTTILVLCHKHKAFDSRKSLHKIIDKTGVVFKSNRLYDNQLPAWINNQVKAEGYSITPEAAQLLSANLGSNLSKIRMELEKLFISLDKNSVINEDAIEENIGISKDFNIFELQKALGAGDVVKANLIIKHFGANPKANPFVLTTALLYQFFAKLLIYHKIKDKSKDNTVAAELSTSPYFVRDYRNAAKRFSLQKSIQAVSLLREYDLKFKGVNNVSADEGELLKELVFKLMH
ncbi:MAG: DNA polymerase III subunit delta [Bacteroidales bacterium]|nr:DNA polymerase III subunit delta [Bacteroidales bacterium]